MPAQRFSAGQRFRWNERVFEVQRLLPADQINILDLITEATQVLPTKTLVTALFQGELSFVVVGKQSLKAKERAALDDYPQHLVEQAKFRLMVITPLLDVAHRTRVMIAERAKEMTVDKQKVSIPSIYRWIKLYEQSKGDIRVLTTDYLRCGAKMKSRLNATQDTIIDEVL